MADIFNMTDTWDNAGTTFTAIKMDVTNTNSAAGSKLIDLLIGGVSKFSVRKDALTSITADAVDGSPVFQVLPSSGSSFTKINNNGTMVIDADVSTGTNPLRIYYNGSEIHRFAATGAYTAWSLVVSPAFNIDSGYGYINKDGSNNLQFLSFVDMVFTARSNAILGATAAPGYYRFYNSTQPQNLEVYNTRTDASNYERAVLSWSAIANRFSLQTEALGSGTLREMGISASVIYLAAVSAVDHYINGNMTSRVGSNYLSAAAATAMPAGGTAGAGLLLSTTSNFGVFFGSGAPSLSAAKGSIYLRSDGSGTTDRMYVNTNGSTTWTAVTTVA